MAGQRRLLEDLELLGAKLPISDMGKRVHIIDPNTAFDLADSYGCGSILSQEVLCRLVVSCPIFVTETHPTGASTLLKVRKGAESSVGQHDAIGKGNAVLSLTIEPDSAKCRSSRVQTFIGKRSLRAEIRFADKNYQSQGWRNLAIPAQIR